MPNNKILTSQKSYYMSLRNSNKSQTDSASRSGISIRTASRIDKSGITKPEHIWRTRKDPLEEVWESDLKLLLTSEPNLQPTTLFEYLEDKYPGKYGNNILRTLQRRVKNWKALSGKEKEVMFSQKHHPAQMGISDFTVFNGEVTIKGKEFNHRLYNYRLVYSRWAYVSIIIGGESYTALAESLQSALIKSGGSPKEHRTDSLSAAFNNHKNSKEELTNNYQQLCDHYNIKPTRNNLSKSHENGSVESSHGHLKNRIRQAILLRGGKDFPDIKEYQKFINKIVARHNSRCSLFDEEQKHLNKLPEHKTQDFSTLHTMVTSSSTINIKKVVYSVPSRLIGEKLTIHLFDDRLEVFVGNDRTCELVRIHNKGQRKSSINYRHIITSLIQKPQAFKNFIWKDDLFPSDTYRNVWNITKQQDSKVACKYFVKLLYLASKLSIDQESDLANYVLKCHESQRQLPTIENCSSEFSHN
jgi:hypothetical protein